MLPFLGSGSNNPFKIKRATVIAIATHIFANRPGVTEEAAVASAEKISQTAGQLWQKEEKEWKVKVKADNKRRAELYKKLQQINPQAYEAIT